MDGGRYRVLQGEEFEVWIASNVAAKINAWVRVVYDNGKTDDFRFPRLGETLATTGLFNSFPSKKVAVRDGWVVDATLETHFADVRRGQVAAMMHLGSSLGGHRDVLMRGYPRSNYSLALGDRTEFGPRSGPGHKHVVNLATDRAGNAAALRSALAVANTYRRVYGFVLKYESDVNSSTRTINIRVENPLAAAPTNFTGDANARFYSLGTISLTANQQGMVYVMADGSSIVVLNDNGSITTSDITTSPNPFPFDVLEADPVEILWDVASGLAGDTYNIDLLVEEWVGEGL